MWAGVNAMLLLIIISVVAAAAIGLYQLLLHKHYWGPKGKDQNKNLR